MAQHPSETAHELDRVRKIAMLDAYLADLEAELGPIPASEQAEAEAWVARVLVGTSGCSRG